MTVELTPEYFETIKKRHQFDSTHLGLHNRRIIETSWDICHSDREVLIAAIEKMKGGQ